MIRFSGLQTFQILFPLYLAHYAMSNVTPNIMRCDVNVHYSMWSSSDILTLINGGMIFFNSLLKLISKFSSETYTRKEVFDTNLALLHIADRIADRCVSNDAFFSDHADILTSKWSTVLNYLVFTVVRGVRVPRTITFKHTPTATSSNIISVNDID